jgi:ribosomal protein L11 methyltransferase
MAQAERLAGRACMAGWIEIALQVDGEGAEAVAEVLRQYAYQGIAIEQKDAGNPWDEEEGPPPGPLTVRGYIPADRHAQENQRRVEEAIYYLRRLYPKIPAPTFQRVEEEDWAEAWKQGYHPIRVGEHFLIRPAWIDVEPKPDDIVIEMDPGMAFGTGTHPTTQLCLQACELFARPGLTMLDLGTGSGILAIGAAKLGCDHVLARDTDEVAVRSAQENVQRNGVTNRVTVEQGSLDDLVDDARQFDLCVANLTAKIITRLAGQGIERLAKPGGTFVFSGLIDDQADEVSQVLQVAGLRPVAQHRLDDWTMLVMQRDAG